jgi:hypothetical protein
MDHRNITHPLIMDLDHVFPLCSIFSMMAKIGPKP